MTNTEASSSVVVGIDGSNAAIHAAEWGIDEAISRDIPLRLVHLTEIEEASMTPAEQSGLAVQYAEATLRAAHAAVKATERW